MAIEMRFNNGTTTFDLGLDAGVGLLNYRPSPAARGARSVREPLALLFVGGQETARENMQAFARFLYLAPESQEERVAIPLLYIEMRDSGGDWWRSEVRNVDADLSDQALDTEYAAGMFVVQASIEREPFFEGPLTPIGLKNNNTFGVYDLNPVQIWNANDSGKDNFVEYEAASIIGDLPAPIQLTITNTFNDADAMYDIYVGLNIFSDPENFNPILEAEDADFKYGGATPTLNVAFSGGYFVTLSWNVQTVVDLLKWDLDAGFLSQCNGGRFKVLVRRDGLTFTQLRVKVTDGVTEYFVGDWVSPLSAMQLIELSAVKLPPYNVGVAGVAGLELVVQARRQIPGTHTETIDFVQLTPLDGYRRLIETAYGVAYTETFVDDAIEGNLYTGSNKVRTHRPEGTLLLQPNRLGRLCFLWTGATGDADYLRTATVQLSYRPRRRAL